MPKSVLILRSAHQAQKTAQTIAQAGHRPVVLPVTKINPIFTTDIDSITIRLDALLLATSANALHFLSDELIQELRGRSIAVVGSGTAVLANSLSFTVEQVYPTADALLQWILENGSPQVPLCYLAGRYRRAELETGLAEAGFDVHPIEVYDTQIVQHTVCHVQSVLLKMQFDYVLFYSGLSVDGFATNIMKDQFDQHFAGAAALALSPRIAKQLESLPFSVIKTAYRPDEQHLLGLLAN